MATTGSVVLGAQVKPVYAKPKAKARRKPAKPKTPRRTA